MNSQDGVTARKPEELVFEACYSPVNLDGLLGSAEGRSRIRRIPIAQLYYGVRRLPEEQLLSVLPHVTEEQWQGLLDLDLWVRDSVRMGRFLGLQRNILLAEPPVARKLVRAVDPELWILFFRKYVRIVPLHEGESVGTSDGEGEYLETPDGGFRIFLPTDTEKARLLRAFVLRLYELDAAVAWMLLLGSPATTQELEEECYRNRKSRLEDLGFLDYFDATSIYVSLDSGDRLPEKELLLGTEEAGILPVSLEVGAGSQLLLKAFGTIESPGTRQALLEELFFVSNKLLSADQVSPADPDEVKRSIQKVIAGINLGLDYWSEGNLARAAEGVRRKYLQSFFQLGLGHVLRLRKLAARLSHERMFDEGSFEEAVLEGLQSSYPKLLEVVDNKWVERFFETRQDVAGLERFLEQWAVGG